VRERWGKLTDDDLELIRSKREKLATDRCVPFHSTNAHSGTHIKSAAAMLGKDRRISAKHSIPYLGDLPTWISAKKLVQLGSLLRSAEQPCGFRSSRRPK